MQPSLNDRAGFRQEANVQREPSQAHQPDCRVSRTPYGRMSGIPDIRLSGRYGPRMQRKSTWARRRSAALTTEKGVEGGAPARLLYLTVSPRSIFGRRDFTPRLHGCRWALERERGGGDRDAVELSEHPHCGPDGVGGVAIVQAGDFLEQGIRLRAEPHCSHGRPVGHVTFLQRDVPATRPAPRATPAHRAARRRRLPRPRSVRGSRCPRCSRRRHREHPRPGRARRTRRGGSRAGRRGR